MSVCVGAWTICKANRAYANAAAALLMFLVISPAKGAVAPETDGGASAAAPSAAPSTAATLPEEFRILQKRNAFSQGHHKDGPTTRGGPEATVVFKGVVHLGSGYTAFIEDIGSKNVAQLSVGDAVARGRLKSIDLDAVEYEAAGETRRIEVGQNFNGEVMPPTPTSKPADPATAPDGAEASQPPGGPPQPGGPPVPGGSRKRGAGGAPGGEAGKH